MADFAEQLQQGATEDKAQISQEIADAQATRTRRRAEMEKELADKKAEYDQLKANAPQPTEPPKFAPPPQAPNTQEMLKPTSLQKQFGLASIFALLSVGIAKGSAIYGLKALGGFMEGAHASNVEQAKAALDDYNSNMRTVHEANENALHEYNAIWQDKKLNWDAKLSLYREKALQFEDKLSIEKLDQDDVNGIHQLERDRANVQKTFATEMLRSEQMAQQMAQHGISNQIQEKRLQLEELRLNKEQTGKPSPSQERQELQTLLKSYEGEVKSAQKAVDSHVFTSPTEAESKALTDAQANVSQIRKRLSEMAGIEAQRAPGAAPAPSAAPRQLPEGGQVLKGVIVVRRKADGKLGTLAEKDFDPKKYEKIPEGQSVQMR
jgi:hypothetical protein